MPSVAMEFFPDISSISYKPVGSTSPSNEDVLCFQHYNPDEVILGKPMKEWLKFSVCYWHTFRGTGMDPFGSPTLVNRPWEPESSQRTSVLDAAKRRVDAAFEFFRKLGVEYYTFHDTDVSPEGETLDETLSNLAEMVDYLKAKQDETGIKLLWATQNLFSHPRYMHGAGTSPDLQVFCWAAAQVQAVMDANHKLGGANHVFWGGREGCTFLLFRNFTNCRLLIFMLSCSPYFFDSILQTKPFSTLTCVKSATTWPSCCSSLLSTRPGRATRRSF
jgi:xylose isomerase